MHCTFCKATVTAEDSWTSRTNPNVHWCNDERVCLGNWYTYTKQTVEIVGEKVA